LAVAPPLAPLGSLQRSPNPLAGFKGGILLREGEEREERRARERSKERVGEG